MSFSTYLVGGEKTFADQFIEKARKQGIDLDMIGHCHWDMGTKGVIPQCDVVIVLKDVVNHMLSGWAKKQAREQGIRFCEISQKISHGIKGLKRTLDLPDTDSQQDSEMTSIFDFKDPTLTLLHDSFLQLPHTFVVSSNKLGSRKSAVSEMFFNFFKTEMKKKAPIEGVFGDVFSNGRRLPTNTKAIKEIAKKNQKQMFELLDAYKKALASSDEDTSALKQAISMWAINMTQTGISEVLLKRALPMIFGLCLEDAEYYHESMAKINKPTYVLPNLDTLLNSKIKEEETTTPPTTTPPTTTPPTTTTDNSEMNIDTPTMAQIINYPYQTLGEVPSDIEAGCKALGVSYDAILADMEALRNALSKRGLGLSRKDFGLIQNVKYSWAKELITNTTREITTLGQLQSLSRDMWSSRISDKYLHELEQMINSKPSEEEIEQEVVETSPVEVEVAQEVVKAEVETAPQIISVKIGDFSASLTSASLISIGEMPQGAISCEGKVEVTIQKVENNTFYGVEIKA